MSSSQGSEGSALPVGTEPNESTLTVPHLELLMRLSLSFRQGGIDLTAESSTPILVEAAKLFDKKKKRR